MADANARASQLERACYVSYAVPVTLALTTAILWLTHSRTKKIDVAGFALVLTGTF